MKIREEYIKKMISVIVPIFNKSPYIKKCLDSICNQTYINLEIICVNDGSTDDSGEIAKKYAKIDSRFIYIEQENQGVSAARNRGLEIANGEYISFIDCDDELENDMYDFLLELMKKYDADIAHCGYKKIHLDGLATEVGNREICLIQNREEALECLISGKYFTGSLCTKLYKSSLFKNVCFDKELKINEDLLVNFKVFNNAKNIVFSGDTKYLYYERKESSSTRVRNDKKLLDSLKVSEYIFENIKANNSLKYTAARKLFYVLTSVYRNYIFYPPHNHDMMKKELCIRIKEIEPLCSDVKLKYRINFWLMRFFPVVYKFLYCIYDSIRKPNWDV